MFPRVCAINYENEAKSDNNLERKAAFKVSYLAISVSFSTHRSLIGHSVCMYALINPEYTWTADVHREKGRGERRGEIIHEAPLRRVRERRDVLSPLGLRTFYYHPLPSPLFLSLSRRSSLSGGRSWYLRANRPVVRIEITSNSLIDISSCYKETES